MGDTLAKNKAARRNYYIEEKFECGISLKGSEVKSIRQGKISIKEAFGDIVGGEVFLMDCRISEYSHADIWSHDPMRPKKLLLHRHEIKRLNNKVTQKGYTIIPLAVYLKGGWIKVTIALARGKNTIDKRHDLKKRQADRDIERAMKLSRQN